MAKKMYYNEQEAIDKLAVSADILESYVRDGKLRVFYDGSRKMYKSDEVEALSSEAQEIDLAPADTAVTDSVSLTETDATPPASKEDTVHTTDSISVFEEGELEIEAADPLAKTQISPSLQEQLSTEGASSGSGLLDLTRESDDTSLGEVLDHIDMESAVGSSCAADAVTESADMDAQAEPAAPQQVAMVEEFDPMAGLFGGLVVGAMIAAMLLIAVMMAAINQSVPTFLEMMRKNMMIVVAGLVVVMGASAVAGFFLGKPASPKRTQEQQAGPSGS